MKKILVLSDGETYEVVNPNILIVELSDEEFDAVEAGSKVRHVVDLDSFGEPIQESYPEE